MITNWLQTLSTVECGVFFLAVNAAVLAFSVTLWHAVRLWKPGSFDLEPAPRVSVGDLRLTASSIAMCVVVSAAATSLKRNKRSYELRREGVMQSENLPKQKSKRPPDGS